MFRWFKKKQVIQSDLYPGVPTTDGTNDFISLYSKLSKKELIKILDIEKQLVVEKALKISTLGLNTYGKTILEEDIKHLGYSIKSIELILRVK